MNRLEGKMFLILKELKDKNNELILKADLEEEGTRLFELSSFAEMVFKAGGELCVKVAGVGAVFDLEICKDFGAKVIMAPMVETAYSLEKFKKTAKRVFKDEIKDVDFIANAETKTCVENIGEIVKAGEGFLKGITVGRVDLCSSLGLGRSEIDKEEVFKNTEILVKKAKEKNFLVSVGGGVLKSSFYVLEKLKEYVNRFETRKFIFSFDGNLEKFEENLRKATEFEVMFLENKSFKYMEMSKEDLTRIKLLKERL